MQAKLRILVTGILLVGALCAVSEAQTVKGGGLSGTVTTVVKSVAGSASVSLLTTPAAGSGFFILTQFCNSSNPGDADLDGSTLQTIVHDLTQNCVTFVPGLALPAGEGLTCANNTNSPRVCTITGVISKK